MDRDLQVVVDGVLGKDLPVLGHEANALPGHSIGVNLCTGTPCTETVPRLVGAIPMMAFMVVPLPAPLRPSSASD